MEECSYPETHLVRSVNLSVVRANTVEGFGIFFWISREQAEGFNNYSNTEGNRGSTGVKTYKKQRSISTLPYTVLSNQKRDVQPLALCARKFLFQLFGPYVFKRRPLSLSL